jgi:hypothetical protein
MSLFKNVACRVIYIHAEYPLSDIPKSENLQNLKLSARRHEHNAVQM